MGLEFKIYHLSLFIITQDAFDIAEPSSMQDACNNEPSRYDQPHSLPVVQWLQRPTAARKFIGSTAILDVDFFFIPLL